VECKTITGWTLVYETEMQPVVFVGRKQQTCVATEGLFYCDRAQQGKVA